MREELIAKLVCPYCLGKFRLASGAEMKNGRVTYGLLSCSCFDFPIVESVLMLGLTKGLGGAEEHVQPYVPLQAAALHYLKSGDVAGLRGWIKKHIPLISLLWRDDITYTEFLKARNKRVMPYVIRDLQKASRFRFLGFRGERELRSDKGLLLRVLETRLGATAASTFRKLKPEDIESDFFYSRFTHFDAPQMEKLLASVAVDGPILSLCCGHGIFELVTKWRWPDAEIVSIDGAFLNLLAVQKFFNPTGDFICHNLELPFPFHDGAFTGSFSSTCLQEIPSRAHFVREQIRSTAPDGWCLFERPWWPEPRVKPLREYRFVQNHQTSATDMYKLINSCAGDRKTFSSLYPYDVVTGWSPQWTANPPGVEVQPERTGDMERRRHHARPRGEGRPARAGAARAREAHGEPALSPALREQRQRVPPAVGREGPPRRTARGQRWSRKSACPSARCTTTRRCAACSRWVCSFRYRERSHRRSPASPDTRLAERRRALMIGRRPLDLTDSGWPRCHRLGAIDGFSRSRCNGTCSAFRCSAVAIWQVRSADSTACQPSSSTKRSSSSNVRMRLRALRLP